MFLPPNQSRVSRVFHPVLIPQTVFIHQAASVFLPVFLATPVQYISPQGPVNIHHILSKMDKLSVELKQESIKNVQHNLHSSLGPAES